MSTLLSDTTPGPQKYRLCGSCGKDLTEPGSRTSFHVGQNSALSTDEIEAAVRELKYPSAKALSKTFSDYLEAHSWAISAIIKTDSLLHYGHAFEDHEPHHVKAHEYYLSRHDPAYLGVLGVSFVINGLPILYYDFVPQYMPRCPSPRPRELTFFEERRIFEDFLNLCFGSLGFEFVFRCSEDQPDGAGVAIPGPLVKKEGKWQWKPFFRSWAEYGPRLVTKLGTLLREMETGRSPKYMMELFHRLRIYYVSASSISPVLRVPH
ncbi:hypothetical protein C8T65DRAFT_738093 [Cerioporus squamosus]|nr:hypothetical protein C8T65DRAFT_738093 [Cerioporus squamosus]